jgi:hypothetical protein
MTKVRTTWTMNYMTTGRYPYLLWVSATGTLPYVEYRTASGLQPGFFSIILPKVHGVKWFSWGIWGKFWLN